MASVFVSYAREDAPMARAIAQALECASFDVWIDERIQSGSEYSREIEGALANAAAVVVLWSRNSVESAWVRDEAAEARDSGRLVPVLLDTSRPPMGFRQFQAADLSRWSGRGKAKQIDDVIAAVAAKAGSARATAPAPLHPPRSKRTMSSAAGVLIFLIIAVAAVWLLRSTEKPPSAPSVALLPFTADVSDADARKLASATRDAIAHTLSAGAFSISILDAAPQGQRAPADYIISGEVNGSPDKFVTTVRMKETAHNFLVFSHQFEAPRARAWDLPEQVGAQVASQLSWTAPLIEIDKRHPSDPAVLKALLLSSTAGLGGDVSDLKDYEAARRIVVQAPNSPLALSQLAFNTANALYAIPRDQRVAAVASARQAADRTIELAPEYGSAQVNWCFLHSEVRRIECEDRIRAGMRAAPDDAFANFFLAFVVLNPVGRNKEAADLASLSLAHDQYMPYKIGLALRTFEATGRTAEAADLYQQAMRWWPDNQIIIWFRESGMAMHGDFEALQHLSEELGGENKPSPALIAINRKSLPAVREGCTGAEDFDAMMCMLALARFGDFDAAYAIVDRLYPSRIGRTPQEQERIWLDNPGATPIAFLTAAAAAPLRKDPRYLAVARRVGLVDYWRSGRLPDFCRDKPEPICAKLSRS